MDIYEIRKCFNQIDSRLVILDIKQIEKLKQLIAGKDKVIGGRIRVCRSRYV